MTNPLAINQVFERLAGLDGQPLELEGILAVDDSGGYELLHYPAAERIACFVDGETEYRKAVWLSFGNGSLQPEKGALQRWAGKRVRVHGILHSVGALPIIKGLGKSGFGPWGMWPAEIEAYILQRVTAGERREYSSIKD